MIGQTISHYRILAKIGEGGMGVVYQAEDTQLKRTVALKFLHSYNMRDPEAKARFLHEAQAAAALNHPNIATVHDIGEADGHTFIVMEFVEGQGLKERLATGPLPIAEALKIAAQVTRGLAKAHEHDIVHRDIKPANVLLTADGQVKIVDFGLAKLGEQTRLTRTGTTLGTVAYMSPEQARGDVVDRSTDLWAVGVMLFEMLTGQLPFRGESGQAVIHSILSVKPEPLTTLSDTAFIQLENVVDRALEKDSAKRYQSAAELLADIEEQQDRLAAGLVSRRFLFWRRFRRNRGVFHGTLAAMAIVLVTAAMFMFLGQGTVIDSIAVLPFEDLSTEPDQEYFAEGVTRELTATLGQISGWSRVISSRSMMRYKGSTKSPSQIASEVNVKALLSGSVQKLFSNTVKVIVELVEGDTERLLWTQSYESELGNFHNLQNDITRTISQIVDMELTASEVARLATARSINPEAYELYLKARHQYFKWSEESTRQAAEFLEKAIEIDPNYAEALAFLADTYVWLGWSGAMPLAEASAKALEFANRALAIGDELSEGHYALAQKKFYLDWDWSGGIEEIERAIELNPNSPWARSEYAWYLSVVGRFDEAIAEAKFFWQLEPVLYTANMSMVWMYYCARRYDLAISQCQQWAEFEPDDHRIYNDMAMVYEQMGRYEDAVRARQKEMTLRGASPQSMAALDSAFSVSGSEGYWGWKLKEEKGRSDRVPSLTAMIHGQLGNTDLAFAWLEKAYEQRAPLMFRVAVEPGWDPLRNDPRFRNLLRRMNLPEIAIPK